MRTTFSGWFALSKNVLAAVAFGIVTLVAAHIIPIEELRSGCARQQESWTEKDMTTGNHSLTSYGVAPKCLGTQIKYVSNQDPYRGHARSRGCQPQILNSLTCYRQGFCVI